MHRNSKRAAVLAAGLLAVSVLGIGAASASQPTAGSAAGPASGAEPRQGDCNAFLTPDNGAAAQCDYDHPGTIQVVIECTNIDGVPYPVTIYGPAVPATAGNSSSATCASNEKVTNYFAVYNP